MKKLLYAIVIGLCLAGLLFANSIPFAVTNVAAYPPPSTGVPTLMPPDYPDNYWVFRRDFPIGTFVAVCHSCMTNYPPITIPEFLC